MLDFSVEMNEVNGIPIIKINGEIDVYNAPRLNEFFRSFADKNHTLIVLNLDNVQYIDSTGLGTIAQAAYAIAQKNGRIHVICTRPSIKKIFEVSGLIKKNISLYESENSALMSEVK